jgi:hypothetical protein
LSTELSNVGDGVRVILGVRVCVNVGVSDGVNVFVGVSDGVNVIVGVNDGVNVVDGVSV